MKKLGLSLLIVFILLGVFAIPVFAITYTKTKCVHLYDSLDNVVAKACLLSKADWLSGSGLVTCVSANGQYYIYDSSYSWGNKTSYCESGSYGMSKLASIGATLYHNGGVFFTTAVDCWAKATTNPPSWLCYGFGN